jgi:hypothetical protein
MMMMIMMMIIIIIIIIIIIQVDRNIEAESASKSPKN